MMLLCEANPFKTLTEKVVVCAVTSIPHPAQIEALGNAVFVLVLAFKKSTKESCQ
jgi:hypothetical protein